MPKFICIAAIDEKNGLADDNGIPWQGKIPTDVKHYNEEIDGGNILMGYTTYTELISPINGRNIVVSNRHSDIRSGFELVKDAREFLNNTKDDICVFGGAKLFDSTIDLVTDLHLTQLQGDFQCTKFFPEYKTKFKLVSKSSPITENGITYRFEQWHRIS